EWPACSEPDNQEWNERDFRKRIECGNEHVCHSARSKRRCYPEPEQRSANKGTCEACKNAPQRDTKIVGKASASEQGDQLDDALRRPRQVQRRHIEQTRG